MEKSLLVKYVQRSLSGIGRRVRALHNVVLKQLLAIRYNILISAVNVETRLLEIESLRKVGSSVHRPVLKNTTTENVRLVSTTYSGLQDVYNFEVDTTHNYILSNGLVVHNCDIVSQLGMMEVLFPINSMFEAPMNKNRGIWAPRYDEDEERSAYDSY